jgi:hypothetical protein
MVLLPLGPLAARAQQAGAFAPLGGADPRTGLQQSRKAKDHSIPDRLPDKPSQPPAFSIPVEPLGFSPPGPIYLGSRNSLASLDFLDENRLLFTFRVPGLMRRDADESAQNEERQIRAAVLTLPTGAIESEALWTLHDRVRYLWMLKDGHFLLRDRDILQEGDAKLALKPLLQFPGSLLWLELDPSEQYLVTNSREPALIASAPAVVPSPGNSLPPPDSNQPAQPQPDPTDFVVRILHRESGKVMLVSRSRSSVHLPINSDGYLEGLRGSGRQWLINLNYFSGGSAIVGRVDSTCTPYFDFLSPREILATVCNAVGDRGLVALDTGGHRLWADENSTQSVWPLMAEASGGSRFAQETLAVTHEVDAFQPLDYQDIKGQLVQVFNAADGKLAFQAPASPPLDAGGNVAISPSGKRVAILNAGAIQVFDLPDPPLLPSPPTATSAR